MNRLFRLLCPLALVLGTARLAEADEVHLVLLHTNDVHGQVLPVRATWLGGEDPPLVGGLKAVVREVQRVRAEVASEEGLGGVLVLDGGDWFQGTPEGQLERGLAFVQLLAAVGYDALALGNHEFDHGLENAARLVREAVPNALCANVHSSESDERPEWVRPWRTVEVAGLTLGLVGLVTPETPVISHPDTRTQLEFLAPEVAVQAALEALPDVDFVLPVGHCGEQECRAIAKAVGATRVPVIVGGHEHRALSSGVREGQTMIVQAGSRGASLGRVDLWIDDETNVVRKVTAQLVSLDPATSSGVDSFDELCDELVERAEAHVAAVVGELTEPLSRARGLETSPAGSWITDVMRARSGADIALHNRGGTRTSLLAGPVTRRDLFELVPFDNHLVTLTLTGAEVWSCFERALSGARSGLDASGLVATIDVAGERARLVSIAVGGEALDLEREYRVTTNSFLAGGGDGYDELSQGRAAEMDPIVMRVMLEESVRKNPKVTPPSDVRLVLVGAEK